MKQIVHLQFATKEFGRNDYLDTNNLRQTLSRKLTWISAENRVSLNKLQPLFQITTSNWFKLKAVTSNEHLTGVLKDTRSAAKCVKF